MKYPQKLVPPYVYGDAESESSLFQGDILEVKGAFRYYFNKFYPAINHEPFERKFVMVLSQSCDLARRSYSPGGPLQIPNTTHIIVCIIRPITSVLDKELSFSGAERTNGLYLLTDAKYESTLTQVTRLINNSEAKNLFFLPSYAPDVPVDSVAVLNVAFPFRHQIYNDLLKQRVATLRLSSPT